MRLKGGETEAIAGINPVSITARRRTGPWMILSFLDYPARYDTHGMITEAPLVGRN